ncbi:hypothetical protein ACS0TY_017795 [Phlomoides rotata]
MASVCGTLLKIDDRTLHRKMGHYARILVEIDMKMDLIAKIMYKRSGICSFANLVFERLPEFCCGCGIVGHSTAACTRSKKTEKDGNNRGRNRRCFASRNRSSHAHTIVATDQKNEYYTNYLEDDVRHGNSEDMHGNKVLALPPIPTKNAFEALVVDCPDSQEESATLMSIEASTQAVGQDCQIIENDVLHVNVDDMQGEKILALPPIPTRNAFDVLVDDETNSTDGPSLGTETKDHLRKTLEDFRESNKVDSTSQGLNSSIREASVPTGTSINDFLKSEAGKAIIASRRNLKSVVDELSISAQESFMVGPIREHNLVAKKPWADIAEHEAFKKALKHGFKIRKK